MKKDPKSCKWFLRCHRPATTTVPHPVLGPVPCCAQCAAFATTKRQPVVETTMVEDDSPEAQP